MAYATPADLGELLTPEPAPPNAARLLTRASRIVDRALLCAVYAVDVDGNPTDPAIIEALKDATCEHVAAWLDNGNDEGIASGAVTSAQIGSVTLSRGGGASGSGGSSDEEDLCAQGQEILRAAGLLNFEPWTG